MNRIRTLVFAITITALMGAGAFARVESPPAAELDGTVVTPAETLAPAQTTQGQTPAPRNDGFGWGWIGLLGLADLAGLRRRDERPVDRDVAYPARRADATTTRRGVAH